MNLVQMYIEKAVKEGKLKELQYLLNNKLILKYENNILHYVSEIYETEHSVKIIRYLLTLDNNYLNIKNKNGFTPLDIAISKGNHKCVIEYIKMGANISNLKEYYKALYGIYNIKTYKEIEKEKLAIVLNKKTCLGSQLDITYLLKSIGY